MTDAPFEAGSSFEAGGQDEMGTTPEGPITQPTPDPSTDGQPVVDDAGTTEQPEMDAGTPADPSPETDTFFDPQTLTDKPELMPAYKTMQASYTRKTQDLAEGKKKIDAYTAFENRFQADPRGTLEQLAKSQGFELSSPGTQPGEPTPFGDGWEPNSWADVQTGLMGMVKSEINQAVNPINKGLSSIENSNFESRLDGIAPEWRSYEQEVADTLTMAPGLIKDPERLLRASLPQKVIEGRAMQAALKRIKNQSGSANVGGSSTSTTRPSTEPEGKMTFREAANAALKEQEGLGN